MQHTKNADLEQRKSVFNKYVKGRNNKKNKENTKIELIQLFEQQNKD